MKRHAEVDVVTIGGGMTASILASQILPTTSYRMVSLEQGPAQWTYPDFAHNHDSLRFQNRYAMMQDLGRTTWTWRPDERSPSLPYRQFGSFHPGQGLGVLLSDGSGHGDGTHCPGQDKGRDRNRLAVAGISDEAAQHLGVVAQRAIGIDDANQHRLALDFF